ncbi:MAG: hypothetical protein QNJ74_27965 [Trichodesmium sp. MO_231.B1]|nr:hypothetical protein [Trichodesmium sp. MO_231.B1]
MTEDEIFFYTELSGFDISLVFVRFSLYPADKRSEQRNFPLVIACPLDKPASTKPTE